MLAVALTCGSVWAAPATCDGLTSIKLSGATVTTAQMVAPGAVTLPTGVPSGRIYKELPEFCRVAGVIEPSSDSHIEFEVWMPPQSAWNGRYLGVGNGGFAGSLDYPDMAAAVKNGYAVSSTDTGHKGTSTEAAWALGHFEKIVDYAYRAIHETADKSKAVVHAFYGAGPRHAYFNSCSNGGRQALLEAQRYPADYDGIVAGAPANYLSHLVAGFVWDAQALDADASTYISASQLRAVESAALTACDALDGVRDGVIDNPSKCHFDPAVLACKDGASGGACLSPAQVAALKKVYDGPRNSKGEQIFPGYVPGGESGLPGWGLWITGLSSGKSLQHTFAQGFFADMAFQDAAWDYRAFTFDRDMKIADDKMAPIFNATDANLAAFKKRGGKLVIYHGWSDAAISPINSVNYYSSVISKMGAKQASEFIELYMVPGMQHCGGGPGPTEFGALVTATDARHSLTQSLEQWVEHGTAPGEIIATKYKSEGNAESGVLRTRPLCPYPQAARYKGSGSTDDAANFTCASGN
jgi:hypothetical protein